MTYKAQAARLGAAAEQAVNRLWAQHQAGRLTRDEFRDLAASTVAAFNVQAARAADVALAVDLTRAGEPSTPLGIVPDDEARLRESFDTILGNVAAGTVLANAALTQIGRWETLAAAQDTYAEGMRRQSVPGWTRVPSATACKICKDLSGSVLPTSVTMYHHPGCGCTQRPVLTRR